jgi:hypothetical protein
VNSDQAEPLKRESVPVSPTEPALARTAGNTPGRFALRLAILFQIGVAQVCLNRLGRRTIYTATLSPEVLWMWAGILSCAVPILIAVLGWVAARQLSGTRWSSKLVGFENVLFGLLAASNLAVGMKSRLALNWTVHVPFVVAMGVLAGWCYGRFQTPRQLVPLLAPGLLLVPLLFWNSVLRPLSGGEPETDPSRQAIRPCPIVWIVLDEISGVSVLNAQRELNTARVPNLAEFARQATFYRNATSVYPRTDHAVPAMLSGRYPRRVVPARAEFYPDNLFATLRATEQFDLTIFEPLTVLAGTPGELRRELRNDLPLPRELATLGTTMLAVWMSDHLPVEQPFPLPEVPAPWFGTKSSLGKTSDQEGGVVRYSWDIKRREQVRHFTRCLRSGDKPPLAFLHVALPHAPWIYTPEGQCLTSDLGAFQEPLAGGLGEFEELWVANETVVAQYQQRYLWQLRYVDSLLGKVFARLKEIGLYDESLIVVTGDHGVAFQGNHSRRVPDAQTLCDIMWVPLLIKRPGQVEGVVTERNVETIDLWPTVADIIGLPLPAPVDGVSLIDKSLSERPRKRFHDEQKELFVDGLFEERWSSLGTFLGRMGDRDDPRSIRQFMPRRDLLDRPVTDFPVVPPVGYRLDVRSPATFDYDASAAFVPGAIRAELVDEPSSAPNLVIAVALNGQIVATARPFSSRESVATLSVLIEPTRFRQGGNVIEWYQVVEGRTKAASVSLSKILPRRG